MGHHGSNPPTRFLQRICEKLCTRGQFEGTSIVMTVLSLKRTYNPVEHTLPNAKRFQIQAVLVYQHASAVGFCCEEPCANLICLLCPASCFYCLRDTVMKVFDLQKGCLGHVAWPSFPPRLGQRRLREKWFAAEQTHWVLYVAARESRQL